MRSFYHESLRTWIETVNKFSISNHTALILGVHPLRSYLKLICEYELYSLPNKKVSGAKDHGKNYIKPPLVSHFLCNCVFVLSFFSSGFYYIKQTKHSYHPITIHTWCSDHCHLNKGECNLNQSKHDSFVKRVAKNNS